MPWILILILSSFSILILSSFPHQILILSSFPHQILILSSFYPHFIFSSSSNPHFILLLSSFPHQILILSSFYPHLSYIHTYIYHETGCKINEVRWWGLNEVHETGCKLNEVRYWGLNEDKMQNSMILVFPVCGSQNLIRLRWFFCDGKYVISWPWWWKICDFMTLVYTLRWMFVSCGRMLCFSGSHAKPCLTFLKFCKLHHDWNQGFVRSVSCLCKCWID